ncbi:MAG: AI-2E family transporter [Gammaproteobacteria bacterium]
MFDVIRQWYQKYFASEEIVVLLLLLLGAGLIISFLGQVLAPFFTAIVIAYLLQGLVAELLRHGVPRLVAVMLVYVLFLSLLIFGTFKLLPESWQQLVAFVDQKLPRLMTEGAELLKRLPDEWPGVISQARIDEVIAGIKVSTNAMTNEVLSFSFSVLPNLLAILIYLVLVPVLVFFFLKDKDQLLSYLLSFLPDDRTVLSQIWREMDRQVSNYVRGKFTEIVIVGVVTYVALLCLGLNYALLLGVLVGLSVVIPYLGAALVTVPVALVGYFQFGFGSEWVTLLVVYGIIQALDGNILVPLLFSEAVNLHPVSIIVAVLIFGGVWGVWGVFFAIPLATMIKSVVSAWSYHVESPPEHRAPPDDASDESPL